MASIPSLRRTDSAKGDLSPLKHFVLAKKKISDVFEQLLQYVKESSEFVEGEGLHALTHFMGWVKVIFFMFDYTTCLPIVLFRNLSE